MTLEAVFNNINNYIFSQQNVDLEHAYIDGTKLEANANKYTWVWKKSCIKSRNNIFTKLSALLEEMNEIMAVCRRVKFEIRQEYTVAYVGYILDTFQESTGIRTEDFIHGKGKHKTQLQRLYEKVKECYN